MTAAIDSNTKTVEPFLMVYRLCSISTKTEAVFTNTEMNSELNYFHPRRVYIFLILRDFFICLFSGILNLRGFFNA